jgi:chromosome partitioning protein
MPRLTVAIQKGGTGKTTTAIGLAAAFAEKGDSVLLLDLDPRGGLTEGVGLASSYDTDHHIGQFLLNDEQINRLDPRELIHDRDDFDVIPANRRMDTLSDQLGQDRGWFRRLDEFLQPFDAEYDWIILDSPPELNRLSDSAIIAARNTIVPVEPAEPSLHGLQKMLEDQLIPIRTDLDDSVVITAIVLNRVLDDNETDRVREDLKQNFAEELAPVEIRKRVAIPRAWRNGETLFEYASESDMCDQYRRLAEFIQQRVETAAIA